MLYAVPEHEDDSIESHNRNRYTLNQPRVDLVIGNASALYQNVVVDDTYSEPRDARDRAESGIYERIKSCIHDTEDETKDNSYAEPSVFLSELIVSENESYVSSQRN